jgi:hypothetical protein
MTEKEIRKKLQDRLEANYQAYIRQFQSRPAPDLIEQAAEIAATKLVYEELHDGCYPAESLEYLLRFENPLEVVRDQWLLEQNTAHDEEMSHVLWTIADKGEAEQLYALEEGTRGSAFSEGVRMC